MQRCVQERVYVSMTYNNLSMVLTTTRKKQFDFVIFSKDKLPRGGPFRRSSIINWSIISVTFCFAIQATRTKAGARLKEKHNNITGTTSGLFCTARVYFWERPFGFYFNKFVSKTVRGTAARVILFLRRTP